MLADRIACGPRPRWRSNLVAIGFGVLLLIAFVLALLGQLSRRSGGNSVDARAKLLALAGLRVGRSTSFCIPAIVDAPGACVVTSNKADLHDATLGVRQQRGRTRAFDPQRLATPAGQDDWWVNVLGPVTSTSSARTVAEYFSSAANGGAKQQTSGDTYFPTEATNALAGYFLAAAVGGGDLLHVMGWLRTRRPHPGAAAAPGRAAREGRDGPGPGPAHDAAA